MGSIRDAKEVEDAKGGADEEEEDIGEEGGHEKGG